MRPRCHRLAYATHHSKCAVSLRESLVLTIPNSDRIRANGASPSQLVHPELYVRTCQKQRFIVAQPRRGVASRCQQRKQNWIVMNEFVLVVVRFYHRLYFVLVFVFNYIMHTFYRSYDCFCSLTFELLLSLQARQSVGVPMLLLAWSVTEVIRYSYYALGLFNAVPFFLTWMR